MNTLQGLNSTLEEQWYEAHKIRALVLSSLAMVRDSDLGAKNLGAYYGNGGDLLEVLEVILGRLVLHCYQLEKLKDEASLPVTQEVKA